MADHYFEIENGAIKRGPISRTLIRTKATSIGVGTSDDELRDLGWLPQVKVGDAPFDPATHKQTGPVHEVFAMEVTSTWTTTEKTAQELDDEKQTAAEKVADSVVLQAAIRALLQVQEDKGGAADTGDLGAIRTYAIQWLKNR